MLGDSQVRRALRSRSLKMGVESGKVDSIFITEDIAAVDWVLTVKDLAERIEKEEMPLFDLCSSGLVIGVPGRPASRALGQLLLRAIVFAPRYVKKHFPYHDLHASVDLFMMMLSTRERLRQSLLNLDACSPTASLAICVDLNGFAEELKANLSSSEFKLKCRRAARKAARSYSSLKAYADSIFDRCSRVLIVRVDLYYSSDFNEGGVSGLNVDRFKIDRDRSRFLNEFRRSTYARACIGYCWKLEYALQKGWHFHWLFFFDGARVRQDVTLGELIGETWKAAVGDGSSYWNCNASRDKYALPGVGMIKHSDMRLRAGLDRAISYLTKPDYVLALSERTCGRTLGKGPMRARASRRGRRRKGISLGKT